MKITINQTLPVPLSTLAAVCKENGIPCTMESANGLVIDCKTGEGAFVIGWLLCEKVPKFLMKESMIADAESLYDLGLITKERLQERVNRINEEYKK